MTEPSAPTRALSFGAAAEHYDRFRPAPPADAVAWVLPPDATEVLDLGAGTGALTRVLLGMVDGTVVAAEPDGRMRAVLARRSPGAVAVGTRAEALPFADGSFDAVVVSSAWHWMDPALTPREVARVLRPGGRLGLLWNGPARTVEWVSELFGPPEPSLDAKGRIRPRHRVDPPADAPFGPSETTVMTWSKPMTREEVVGLTGTYSRVIGRPAEEQAEIRAAVERLLDTRPALADHGTVELPMACRCWRATRL